MSRKHEFEADRFAARNASAGDLVNALVKLYQDNVDADPGPGALGASTIAIRRHQFGSSGCCGRRTEASMVKTVEQPLTSNSRSDRSAIGEAEVVAQLTALDNWRLDAGSLTKAYRFKNHYEMIVRSSMRRHSWCIVKIIIQNCALVTTRCEVRFNTHSVSISENDFIAAPRPTPSIRTATRADKALLRDAGSGKCAPA